MSPLMSRVDLMSLAKLVVRALGLGLGNSMFSIYKGMFLRGQWTDDDGDRYRVGARWRGHQLERKEIEIVIRADDYCEWHWR